MNVAKWIWLKGDFEIYHSLQVHTRREERGIDHPAQWHLNTPYPAVVFKKEFTAEKAGIFKVLGREKGAVKLDGIRHRLNTEISYAAGTHTVEVPMMCTDGSFPCIYINSDGLITDETWKCYHMTRESFPVGCMDDYTEPSDDPRIFKFLYSPIKPISIRTVEAGTLYDFGKETFCRITLSNADPKETYRLILGESEEEALDSENAILQFTLNGQSEYRLHARAFRYIHVQGKADSLGISAEYEYLPLKDRASFSCNNSEIKKIWDLCAYTFHLNSREFYLDGIKRDRWVWSGDAYQSYMANNYLYFDPEITKRTILALLGKPPYEQHINTINDYSMYLIISVEEYYRNTGDTEFIRFVWKRIRALYEFIAGRTDENDYVCEKAGDWIFIDWSPMDKSGNLCAEQILYWKTKHSMATLAQLSGESADSYLVEAETLKERILKDYWREEKGAFIDCYSSGKENVTRHANIFAILYDFADEDKIQKIRKNVLGNDEITPITTPYFEFFELLAYGKLGLLEHIQDKIESYWGGILQLGGTSVWEQFDPNKKGIEHYKMYGKKFGCSLCHAWGSGPIYLLGRFCLGVFPTDVAYKTFCVEPNPGRYTSFRGSVPLPKGEVTVDYDNGKLTVIAGAEGGTLRWNGREYALQKDVPLTL